jgi:hypothetical protein
VNPGLPDGGLHSDEGRADIAYCATCHTDAEPTCTLCH